MTAHQTKICSKANKSTEAERSPMRFEFTSPQHFFFFIFFALTSTYCG